MKETINYYYNVYPNEVYYINNGVYFFLDEIKYYFVKFERDLNEINVLVKISNDLYNRNILVDTFIKTKTGNFYVNILNEVYVLLRVNSYEDDACNLKDIVYFNNLLISNNNSINLSWPILWAKKIDEFELSVSEVNLENPIVVESFDYFVGLAENAISYFNEINILDNTPLKVNINHKRIPPIIYSGYLNNPLTFTFDYEVRDIAEYIKVKFFKDSIDYEEIEDLILSSNFNRKSLGILFSRLLYPSYYFDTLKSVLTEEKEESELLIYIDKTSSYEDFLLDIYNLINKKYKIPLVEWLKKER